MEFANELLRVVTCFTCCWAIGIGDYCLHCLPNIAVEKYMKPELRELIDVQTSIVKQDIYKLRSLLAGVLQVEEFKLAVDRFQKAYDAWDEFQEWVKAR